MSIPKPEISGTLYTTYKNRKKQQPTENQKNTKYQWGPGFSV